MNKFNKRILVQTLVGGKEINFYIECLKSLIGFCKDPIKLLLHTDGSLTSNDKDRVLSMLGDNTVSFSDAKKCKEATLDQLKGKPNCQMIRNNSLWGIEFFDPLFVDNHEQYSFYIDADILFIKPFKGLFDKDVVKSGALFLKDAQWDAYSMRPWHLLGSKKKLQIVQGITTALVCWDKSVIDWDYLEWFLGENQFHGLKEWILPSAQSGLAARCSARTIASSQVLNMYPNAKIKKNTFGLHLLGSFRQSWFPKIENYRNLENFDHPPLSPIFENCQLQTPLGYGMNQVKRWINTRLDWW